MNNLEINREQIGGGQEKFNIKELKPEELELLKEQLKEEIERSEKDPHLNNINVDELPSELLELYGKHKRGVLSIDDIKIFTDKDDDVLERVKEKVRTKKTEFKKKFYEEIIEGFKQPNHSVDNLLMWLKNQLNNKEINEGVEETRKKVKKG